MHLIKHRSSSNSCFDSKLLNKSRIVFALFFLLLCKVVSISLLVHYWISFRKKNERFELMLSNDKMMVDRDKNRSGARTILFKYNAPPKNYTHTPYNYTSQIKLTTAQTEHSAAKSQMTKTTTMSNNKHIDPIAVWKHRMRREESDWE